jgi:serine phosphatase RsbU (regulator of sigma subunit)
MRIVLFVGLVAFPLALLVSFELMDKSTFQSMTAMWIAGNLILLVPLAHLISRVLALNEISTLNKACLQMKEGNLCPFESVPVEPAEPGTADELQLLRSNMFWMSHAIESRQVALNNALKDLAGTQQQVLESLDYASLIQKAFLPTPQALDDIFQDHFLIWEQRDAVGGDSYWLRKSPEGVFVAVVDCTGHGVPGAFMTLIVHSLFERLDVETVEGNPAKVLSAMNREIKKALAQQSKNSNSDDGMDCAVCYIPGDCTKVVFAGARNSLFVRHSDGVISEVKGDRCGVGFVRSPENYEFTNTEIAVHPNTRFYLFTDGLIDQIGGDKRLPFGKKRLKRFLSEHGLAAFAEQRTLLEQEFSRYRGGEPCRDDRTMLGFSLERRR